MRILLTGADGFIGTNLQKFSSCETVPFSFSRGDIDAIDFAGIDAVVHLAALVHRMDPPQESEYFRINCDRSVALAEKAKAAGVKLFVFMSTVKVYGEESDLPYTEESPCCPIDPYGSSKLRAEQMLRSLEDNAFKVAVVRAPLVYGEGVKANMLNLIRLVERLPFLPFGSVNNMRSMVYVGNLAHLVTEIIRQHKSGVFLAADDEPVSTARLSGCIARAMGKKARLIPCPPLKSLLRIFKPALYRRLYSNLYVDNRKTVETLRLKNPYSFDDGIKKMVGFYRKNQT